MAVTVPFKVLRKFLNETIEILSTTGRDEFAEPLKIEAVVMQSDPFALGDGIGPDSQKPKYTVMIPMDSLNGVEIRTGAKIKGSKTHPRLFVNSVHSNSDCLWMDCISNEGAA